MSAEFRASFVECSICKRWWTGVVERHVDDPITLAGFECEPCGAPTGVALEHRGTWFTEADTRAGIAALNERDGIHDPSDVDDDAVVLTFTRLQ